MSSSIINPPPRLLMGPGPINADPRVLQAMSNQLIGQYDPVMTGYMNETMALYRQVFKTQNQWTLLVDGTARAGIEAVLVSILEPGDKVLIPVFGRFGHLLKEICERAQAEIHTIEAEWGAVVEPEQVEEAIKKVRPKVFATVQGDTSTTMLQPLQEIGAICRRYDVLFYCDATASVVGNTLLVDEWHLDAVSVGLQKCLGGPSGSAPITLSDRYVAEVRKRHHVEAGIRTDQHQAGSRPRILSNYFDVPMLLDYWGEERLNHHTEATTMLYGARECARLVLEEGVENCVIPHELHGRGQLELKQEGTRRDLGTDVGSLGAKPSSLSKHITMMVRLTRMRNELYPSRTSARGLTDLAHSFDLISRAIELRNAVPRFDKRS